MGASPSAAPRYSRTIRRGCSYASLGHAEQRPASLLRQFGRSQHGTAEAPGRGRQHRLICQVGGRLDVPRLVDQVAGQGHGISQNLGGFQRGCRLRTTGPARKQQGGGAQLLPLRLVDGGQVAVKAVAGQQQPLGDGANPGGWRRARQLQQGEGTSQLGEGFPLELADGGAGRLAQLLQPGVAARAEADQQDASGRQRGNRLQQQGLIGFAGELAPAAGLLQAAVELAVELGQQRVVPPVGKSAEDQAGGFDFQRVGRAESQLHRLLLKGQDENLWR